MWAKVTLIEHENYFTSHKLHKTWNPWFAIFPISWDFEWKTCPLQLNFTWNHWNYVNQVWTGNHYITKVKCDSNKSYQYKLFEFLPYLNFFWIGLTFSIWRSLPTKVLDKGLPFQRGHQWSSSSTWVQKPPSSFQSWLARVCIQLQGQIHYFVWTRGYPCSWLPELRLARPKRPK